jgi:hypothetical protein
MGDANAAPADSVGGGWGCSGCMKKNPCDLLAASVSRDQMGFRFEAASIAEIHEKIQKG